MSTEVLDWLAAGLTFLGSILALIGALAMVRFSGIYARAHTATKPQTLGLFCVLLGLALALRSWNALGTLFIVGFAQIATVPVAVHMLTRAAYYAGVVRRNQLYRDDLGEAMRRNEVTEPEE